MVQMMLRSQTVQKLLELVDSDARDFIQVSTTKTMWENILFLNSSLEFENLICMIIIQPKHTNAVYESYNRSFSFSVY